MIIAISHVKFLVSFYKLNYLYNLPKAFKRAIKTKCSQMLRICVLLSCVLFDNQGKQEDFSFMNNHSLSVK